MTAERASRRVALALLALGCSMSTVLAQTSTDTGAGTPDALSLVYLERERDPAYRPRRAYTGLALRDRHRPLAGARTAIRASRILGRALGMRFELLVRTLADDEPAADVLSALAAQGQRIVIVDLPLDELLALGALLQREDLLLFNPRHPDDRLRGEDCAPALFHTLSSRAMLSDALAQFLRAKRWSATLVLVGEAAADRDTAQAFAGAARKFGLEIVDTRSFVLGSDPRERWRNNVALLTRGRDYDTVFVADSFGEFGRYVPFDTQQPRPVVGSEGLRAGAWHWTWERHGAPQLNQRFDRVAKRRMTATDYAAWIAVKAVIEAVVRTRSTRVDAIRAKLLDADFVVDTYTGAPGSFRSWNRQLRHSLLLHTHNAVIARAPIDGFVHERNNLDTLGADRRESRCPYPG